MHRFCLALVCLLFTIKPSFLQNQNLNSLHHRTIYYDLGGVNYSISVSSSFAGFITFTSVITIDLHSVFHIDSIVIRLSRNYQETLNVFLGGDSPYGPRKKICSSTSSGDNMSFSCKDFSRFVHLTSSNYVELTLWIFQGNVAFMELFYGCFEYTEDTSSFPLMMNFRDCLSYCSLSKDTFAGVQNSKCICLKKVDHLQRAEIAGCLLERSKGHLVGAQNTLPLYLADFEDFERQAPVSVGCLGNIVKCVPCEPGFRGIPCIRRDCQNSKGACGIHLCKTFNGSTMENSVCHCTKGFLAHYFKHCRDIDECLDPLICDRQSTSCENLPGSYFCKCLNGFEPRNSRTCIDIDECEKGSNSCDRNSTDCQNTVGSYSCPCKNGFMTFTAFACTDNDECLNSPCEKKNSKCKNTMGSYYCQCLIGFGRVTDFICTDVDECQGSDLCDSSSTNCFNEMGSYSCLCKSGFERMDKYSCSDIDECDLGLHKCDKSADCLNTAGSFKCGCGPGFLYQKYTYLTICEDIDECKVYNICNLEKSICLNHRGGYSCPCRAGYVKADNFTCKVPEVKNTTTEGEDFYYWSSNPSLISVDLNLGRILPYIFFPLFGLSMVLVMIVVKINSLSWKRSSESYSESESTLDDDDYY